MSSTSFALPRPTERVAIVSMLLVFLCGSLLGAVAMSYWFHPNVHGGPSGGRVMSMSMKEFQQLNLTEEQTRQLTSVLDDFSRYYDNLLADGNSRVLQILNAEQKRRYEQLIRDHKK
jgi:hypothetical protein